MSKKLALMTACVALWTMIALGTPITEEILGTWINVDPEAGALLQIVILPAETGGLNVFGYGVCEPACDWGSTPLYLASTAPQFIDEWGIAIWEDDPIIMVLTFQQQGDLLVGQYFSMFTDGTGMPLRSVVVLRQVF
jgi:hypothetical protein